MRATIFVVLLCLFILCFANESSTKAVNIYTGIGLEDVERTIDLSRPNIVRQSITVTATNAGDKTANQIYFALSRQAATNVAFFEIEGVEISHTKFEHKLNNDVLFYEFNLRSPLEPKGKTILKITIISINVVVPYPEFINQKDNQKLVYTDNLYLVSPYAVKKQRTFIKLDSAPIESYTEVRPFEQRSGGISYGPYSDQKPFAAQELRVHFQNNHPFGVATSLERTLEISHWGALSVEEHYVVRHAGAKLKGSFSRLDYSRNPYANAPSHFRTLNARLPAHASDIYYRDRIGNISTSTVREAADKSVEVEFVPRFPLFGGWKTTFYMGYTAPISDFLFVEDGKYVLKAPFSSSFDGVPVEDLTVKVIIPEGASNFKFDIPFAVDSVTVENLKTYLDVSGRTVYVFRKRNAVKEHNQIFKLSYDFTTSGLLQEPFLVIGALFAFCIVVMTVTRIDLSITNPDTAKEQEAATRITELVEQYTEKHNEKSAVYTHIENNVSSYLGSLDSTKKQLDALNNDIDAVKSEITKVGRTDVASKIANIETQDKTRWAKLEEIIKIRKDFSENKIKEDKMKQSIQKLDTEYTEVAANIVDLVEELNQSVE